METAICGRVTLSPNQIFNNEPEDKHSIYRGQCTNSNILMTMAATAPGKGGGLLERPTIEKATPGRDSEFDLRDLDAAHYSDKYKKYEADYVRCIKAKYFSKKNLYGGNVFENETVIENEAIKSSRWPCTRSFTDPVHSFEDHSRSSSYAAETSTNPSNKKYHCKKSSS